MITRSFRSPLLLVGAIVIAFGTACNPTADTTAVMKPNVASFFGDSTCADSVLSFSTLADSGPHVAEGAAYSAYFTVSNSGANACYTSAVAVGDSVPVPVYADSTVPSAHFRILVGGEDQTTVTGYYHGGGTPGFGFFGIAVSDFPLSEGKIFVDHP